MEENRKKRGGASAAILLSLLLVAYPLSIGPATTLLGVTNSHPAAMLAFKVAYSPVAAVVTVLPKRCEDAVDRWIALWDFYGVF
jgi:predicted permease